MSASPKSIPSSPEGSQQDEAAEHLSELKRSNACFMSPDPVAPPGYLAEDPEIPDLGYYLSAFDLTYSEQVRICRTYASYLAAQIPKRSRKE